MVGQAHPAMSWEFHNDLGFLEQADACQPSSVCFCSDARASEMFDRLHRQTSDPEVHARLVTYDMQHPTYHSVKVSSDAHDLVCHHTKDAVDASVQRLKRQVGSQMSAFVLGPSETFLTQLASSPSTCHAEQSCSRWACRPASSKDDQTVGLVLDCAHSSCLCTPCSL